MFHTQVFKHCGQIIGHAKLHFFTLYCLYPLFNNKGVLVQIFLHYVDLNIIRLKSFACFLITGENLVYSFHLVLHSV